MKTQKMILKTACLFSLFSPLYAENEETEVGPTYQDRLDSFVDDVRSTQDWTEHDRVIAKQRAFFPTSPVLATGSLLYLRAYEDGLDYVTSLLFDPITENVREAVGEPHFKWNYGFRVGLLYRFRDHDAFDLAANWFSFKDHAGGSTSTNGNANKALFGSWGGKLLTGPTKISTGMSTAAFLTNKAKAHLNMNLNILDVELGKRYFITKYIVFHPTIGVRSAWDKQDYRVSYNVAVAPPTDIPASGFPSSLEAEQDFYGIGVKSGFGLNFFLNDNIIFTGRLAGSLLSGWWDVDQEYNTYIPAFQSLEGMMGPEDILNEFPTTIFENNDYHRAQGILEGAVGIQWGTNFSSGKYRLNIGIEYEVMEWFRHNYLLRSEMNEIIPNTPFSALPPPPISSATFLGVVNDKEKGEMGYQGVNLTVQLDF